MVSSNAYLYDSEIGYPDNELYFSRDSVLIAKEMIIRLKSQKIWVNSKFEDNRWRLRTNIKKNTFQYIDFSDYHKENVTSIKCWLINLIGKIETTSVISSSIQLRKVMSHAGDIKFEFKSIFESIQDILPTLSQTKSGSLLAVSINYFMYVGNIIEYELKEELINELVDLKSKYPIKTQPRDLPPFLDVQKFSYFLYSYFNKCTTGNYKLYLPIKIWWDLTSIIPLRSGEFVDIPRNCLIKNGQALSIRLPRSKLPASSRNIEVVDVLPIPQQIYDDIYQYIKFTDEYGESKTLLSYKALKVITNRIHKRKHVNESYFLLADFNDLLETFCEELEKEYNIKFISKKDFKETESLYMNQDSNQEKKINNYSQRINSSFLVKPQPNDTRHFAICNMMLQGVDPLVIARAAGHKHLDSQYHYQGHLQFFVESTTYETLIKKSITNLIELENFRLDLVTLRNNSLAPREMFNYLEEVEIGYCTDRKMRCESRICLFCSFNYIPSEQLDTSLEEIYQIAEDSSKQIRSNSRLLEAMYRSISYNYSKGVYNSPNELEEIKRTAKLIKGGIEDYTTLLMNIGGGSYSGT